MIDSAASGDPSLRRLLERHPRVCRVDDDRLPGIRWNQTCWSREVRQGDPKVTLYGLVELMDNNPLVCADVASVPSPAATLALIAIGPLAAAGLLAETPTMIVNFPADEGEISCFLATEGWSEGISVHSEPLELDGVGAATVMAAVRTPADLDDIDALYEERFGRSFFVHRDEDSEWTPELVRGTPNALYRLRIAPETPVSLLTIRLLAAFDGKLGAAQLVHAMNVMAGVEESLGIDILSR